MGDLQAFTTLLLVLLTAAVPACCVAHPSGSNSRTTKLAISVAAGGATLAAPTSSITAAPASSSFGSMQLVMETIDFTRCQSPHAETGQAGDTDSIRCSLSSELVAEQSGSACFDVNRLLDANNQPLFETPLIDEAGSAFVVEPKFELYRCRGRPVAVFQSGQYFENGPSADGPCHRKRAAAPRLRRRGHCKRSTSR